MSDCTNQIKGTHSYCSTPPTFPTSLAIPPSPPFIPHHHSSLTTTPPSPPHLPHHHTSLTTTPPSPPHLPHHHTSLTTIPPSPPHLPHHHTSLTTTPPSVFTNISVQMIMTYAASLFILSHTFHRLCWVYNWDQPFECNIL